MDADAETPEPRTFGSRSHHETPFQSIQSALWPKTSSSQLGDLEDARHVSIFHPTRLYRTTIYVNSDSSSRDSACIRVSVDVNVNVHSPNLERTSRRTEKFASEFGISILGDLPRPLTLTFMLTSRSLGLGTSLSQKPIHNHIGNRIYDICPSVVKGSYSVDTED